MSSHFVIESVGVDSLRPDPLHARRMSDEDLSSLERSIHAHGMPAPIIVARDGFLIADGHQRLIVARRLGWTEVPVVYVDMIDDDARLLGLGLNRIRGDWDATLAGLLSHLKAQDRDLTLTGFSDDELAKLLGAIAADERRGRVEEFDPEDAYASASREPRSQPGTVWRLGQHHVACGDAADPAAISRLIEAAGRRPAMAFTDPPYGVSLGDHGGHQRGTRRRRIANDDLPPEAFEALLRASMTHLVASVDGALYVCMSTQEWPRLGRILDEVGGHWSDTIIWVKDRHVLGRADYQRRFEPIWYGWPQDAKRHWSGGRRQTDVWEIDRPASSPLHPTMKPLELVERAIDNSCPAGGVVIDPFLGSGTTIIAAERTGRRGLGLELDPILVDVAVRRWERFTGATAEQIDG